MDFDRFHPKAACRRVIGGIAEGVDDRDDPEKGKTRSSFSLETGFSPPSSSKLIFRIPFLHMGFLGAAGAPVQVATFLGSR